jgi:hypothetical protein
MCSVATTYFLIVKYSILLNSTISCMQCSPLESVIGGWQVKGPQEIAAGVVCNRDSDVVSLDRNRRQLGIIYPALQLSVKS